MRRLFWVTIVVGAAVLLLSFAGAAALVAVLAGCYIDVVPMPDHPACGSGLWGHEWTPAALLAGAVLMLAISVGMIVAALMSQFGGARRLTQALESHPVVAPDRLLGSAERAGVTDLRCVTSEVPLAMTFGVRHPRVLVTDAIVDLLDDDELQAVLAHERAHVDGRHPAVYGLARTAANAAFLVPGVRGIANRVVLEGEIEADAAASRRNGVRPLVSALTKLSEADHGTVAVGSIAGMVDQRIRVLAGMHGTWSIPNIAVARILLGLCLLAVPFVAVLTALLRANGVI